MHIAEYLLAIAYVKNTFESYQKQQSLILPLGLYQCSKTFSLYLADVTRFTSVHHTNINRLFITPTRNWISGVIFSQTGSPRRVDCLAPLWEFRCKVSFPRTQQCIAQFRNRTER